MRNAAVVRTRTSVMFAETVTSIAALRRCTQGLFAIPSMRRRVNPYSVFVDVGTVLDKLRLAWRGGRRCVCVDPKGCSQSHTENQLHKSFHVDFPCLSRF